MRISGRDGTEAALARGAQLLYGGGGGGARHALGTGQDRAAYRAAMIRTGEDRWPHAAQAGMCRQCRIARMFAHTGDADRAMLWLEAPRTRARESALAVWASSGIGMT